MSNKRKHNDDCDNGENIWRFGAVADSSGFGWKCFLNYTVLNSRRYRCLLCDHEEGVSMSNDEKINHLKDPNHVMHVQRLKSKQEARIEQVMKLDEVKHDLQRLGFVPPESIKTLLVEWFMMEGKVSTKNTAENAYKEMKRLCEMYQKHEPLVLLELALWKNTCLLNPPTEIESSPMNLVSYLLRGGWKEHKSSLRHDPMIGIVITNVLPFLDM